MDAAEEERISAEHLKKVLWQFQIAHVEDTLHVENDHTFPNLRVPFSLFSELSFILMGDFMYRFTLNFYVFTAHITIALTPNYKMHVLMHAYNSLK